VNDTERLGFPAVENAGWIREGGSDGQGIHHGHVGDGGKEVRHGGVDLSGAEVPDLDGKSAAMVAEKSDHAPGTGKVFVATGTGHNPAARQRGWRRAKRGSTRKFRCVG